jgi:hypothetical protein
MAFMNPIADAARQVAKTRKIPKIGWIWVFDHKLTAQDEALPKHLPGVSCRYGHRGEAAKHQWVNENLHDASSLLEAWQPERGAAQWLWTAPW